MDNFFGVVVQATFHGSLSPSFTSFTGFQWWHGSFFYLSWHKSSMVIVGSSGCV